MAFASSSATRKPRSARSSAAEQPVMPPPTIATSTVISWSSERA
jgi:hypothetical protein